MYLILTFSSTKNYYIQRRKLKRAWKLMCHCKIKKTFIKKLACHLIDEKDGIFHSTIGPLEKLNLQGSPDAWNWRHWLERTSYAISNSEIQIYVFSFVK